MGTLIDWDGNLSLRSPFPPGVTDSTQVYVEFRNGMTFKGVAQSFGWAHNGIHPETHVVKYQVL